MHWPSPLVSSGGQEGRSTSLGDDGQLAFFAEFTDGTSGIFVASTNPDSDGDGIPDAQDLCPDEDAGGWDADANGCVDNVADLILFISDQVDLPGGIENALLASATAAQGSLAAGNSDAARGQLGAIENKIKALQGGRITEEDAAILLEFTGNLIAQLP
jgi:hypothetical protein